MFGGLKALEKVCGETWGQQCRDTHKTCRVSLLGGCGFCTMDMFRFLCVSACLSVQGSETCLAEHVLFLVFNSLCLLYTPFCVSGLSLSLCCPALPLVLQRTTLEKLSHFRNCWLLWELVSLCFWAHRASSGSIQWEQLWLALFILRIFQEMKVY